MGLQAGDRLVSLNRNRIRSIDEGMPVFSVGTLAQNIGVAKADLAKQRRSFAQAIGGCKTR